MRGYAWGSDLVSKTGDRLRFLGVGEAGWMTTDPSLRKQVGLRTMGTLKTAE